PYITYTQSRVDIDEMVIAKNVYEDRKEQFTKRIEAIIEYASNNNVCRSRQLLRYFGETKSHDCNVCDVCVSSRSDRTSDEDDKFARQAVIVLLEDGEKHMINELHQLNIPKKQLDNALRYLVNEEIIHLDGSLIYL
ncbi:RecQ family zinc-binding domain-containing protein, partial [Hallella bergensis]|uniref:RecQ family zinc-binding domain-containing protein n=1 Tax=Hallella bergensis TaxID=242750 RepID=UPI0039905A72